MKKLPLGVTLAILALLGVTDPAHAANRTDYPHRGEVVGHSETSRLVGHRNMRRPAVFLVGDSISTVANAGYRKAGVKWEISSVSGRDVGNLPYYVSDRAASKRRPLKTLVIALGTNASQNWSYADYRRATHLVPPRTRIVFVTTYRDPLVFLDTGFRVSSAQQAIYSAWMKQIARVRPHTCIADWRAFALRYPSATHDGVHPSPAGRDALVGLVTRAVRTCR